MSDDCGLDFSDMNYWRLCSFISGPFLWESLPLHTKAFLLPEARLTLEVCGLYLSTVWLGAYLGPIVILLLNMFDGFGDKAVDFDV